MSPTDSVRPKRHLTTSSLTEPTLRAAPKNLHYFRGVATHLRLLDLFAVFVEDTHCG